VAAQGGLCDVKFLGCLAETTLFCHGNKRFVVTKLRALFHCAPTSTALSAGRSLLRSADAVKGKLLNPKSKLPDLVRAHDLQVTYFTLWKSWGLFHHVELSPHKESRLDAESIRSHAGTKS
jgi:hypothetical protein